MSKMIIRSFEEENKRRKNLRVIAFLISIPFLILVSLFSFKVITMFSNADTAISTFEGSSYSESKTAADKLKDTNIIQPWLAYFDSGTALSAGGKYPESISDLKKSLELVGDAIEQCQVRANLALTYENYGDAFSEKSDTEKAEQNYSLAKTIIEEAPQDCFPPQSGGEGAEEGQSMTETKERVEEKTEAGEEPSEDGSGDSDSDPSDTSGEEEKEQTPEEKIDEQMDQTNGDRTNKENQERGEQNGSSTPVEKPW